MNLRGVSVLTAQNLIHIGVLGPFLATNLGCYLRQYRSTLCSFCMSCYVGWPVQLTVSSYLATIFVVSRSIFHSHLWDKGHAIVALESGPVHLPIQIRFARNLTRSARQFQISAGFLNNPNALPVGLHCRIIPFRKKICTGVRGVVYIACLRQ